MSFKIPYVDFGPTTKSSKIELTSAFERVLDSGRFILGEEVKVFEKEFAEYCGTKYAAGLANGTCSLHLIFRALGIGPGDEVITTPNTFIATASAIAQVGAKPVFVDTKLDFNIDPDLIESAITKNTKAIVPVHLTGRIAKMNDISNIAKANNLLSAVMPVAEVFSFNEIIPSMNDIFIQSVQSENPSIIGTQSMFTE